MCPILLAIFITANLQVPVKQEDDELAPSGIGDGECTVHDWFGMMICTLTLSWDLCLQLRQRRKSLLSFTPVTL